MLLLSNNLLSQRYVSNLTLKLLILQAKIKSATFIQVKL